MAFFKRVFFKMAAVVLIFTAGCQFSSTAVATWRGRLVLAANININNAPEFVLYISTDATLEEWKILGTFAGHVGNMAVVDDDIWFSFGNGPPQKKTLSPDGHLLSQELEKFELDFTGNPQYIQTSPDGTLWLVGHKESRVKLATLSNNGDASWSDDYPLGPTLPMTPTKGKKLENGEHEIIPPKMGLFTTLYADGLYVFWSVYDDGDNPLEKIFGAVLKRDELGEYKWSDIKGFEHAHSGLAGSVSEDNNPVLWLGQAPTMEMNEKTGPYRFIYNREENHWSEGEFVDASAGAYALGFGPEVHAFTLGDIPHLLLKNQYRLYIQAKSNSHWVGVPRVRPKWDVLLRLLPEFVQLSFGMGQLILLSLMVVLLVKRFSGVPNRLSFAEIEERNPPVSIMPRLSAGAIDIMFIGGAIIIMLGNRDIPRDPMFQGIGLAVRAVVIIVAITVINTVTEILYGVSIGKFAVGLRVETIDGHRPTPVAIIKRNIIRIVDFMPFPMAALGIASIFFTRNRQRLGDKLARTVVVKAGPYTRTKVEE